MTPLQTKHQIEAAIDQAKKHGFTLDIHNQIDILATRKPYVRGVRIATLSSFEAVICFFNGYSQHEFEAQEIARGKKDAAA